MQHFMASAAASSPSVCRGVTATAALLVFAVHERPFRERITQVRSPQVSVAQVRTP